MTGCRVPDPGLVLYGEPLFAAVVADSLNLSPVEPPFDWLTSISQGTKGTGNTTQGKGGMNTGDTHIGDTHIRNTGEGSTYKRRHSLFLNPGRGPGLQAESKGSVGKIERGSPAPEARRQRQSNRGESIVRSQKSQRYRPVHGTGPVEFIYGTA